MNDLVVIVAMTLAAGACAVCVLAVLRPLLNRRRNPFRLDEHWTFDGRDEATVFITAPGRARIRQQDIPAVDNEPTMVLYGRDYT